MSRRYLIELTESEFFDANFCCFLQLDDLAKLDFQANVHRLLREEMAKMSHRSSATDYDEFGSLH